jgi:hypothetical protein
MAASGDRDYGALVAKTHEGNEPESGRSFYFAVVFRVGRGVRLLFSVKSE